MHSSVPSLSKRRNMAKKTAKQKKFDRIQDTLARLDTLSKTLWKLVKPLPVELNEIREDYYEGGGFKDLIDDITRTNINSGLRIIHTCQDVLDLRENKRIAKEEGR